MPTEFRLGRLKDRYVVSWWVDGRRHRHRLESPDFASAQREAVEVVRRETAPRAPQTIAEIWSAYIDDMAGRPVVVTMRHNWKALGPHFGAMRPDVDLVPHCRAYTAQRRAAGISDGTVWTELGHLRMVLLWAERRRIIPRAPAVERPPKPAPRERYLTRPEVQRLVDAANGHVRLAILLMLSTAGRIGAVLDLTWDRVDFERRQIRLRADDSVTRKGRATVPINDGLMAALTTARREALSDYVVEWAGGQVGSIKTGFRAAVKAAGLEDVTPHVIRHTAAVWMAEAGVPMDEIAQYLGHGDARITARVYARFSPTHLRRAAEVLDIVSIRQVR
jgi:integrase